MIASGTGHWQSYHTEMVLSLSHSVSQLLRRISKTSLRHSPILSMEIISQPSSSIGITTVVVIANILCWFLNMSEIGLSLNNFLIEYILVLSSYYFHLL